MKKSKQILSILLTLCILVSLFPACALEGSTPASDEEHTLTDSSVSYELTETVSGYCGGEGDGTNLTWTLTTDGTLTISGTGAMDDYSYSTRAPWTVYYNHITNLVIDDSVTSIGNWAFYSCDSLSRVVIGDSVTSIGDLAFSHCDSLSGVVIPDSVISIGYSAFYYCLSLTNVVIGDSVTSIGNSAFFHCDFLSCVVIGDSVTSIGDYAFYYCGLSSVVIPDSVISIGYSAFSYCDLSCVVIGDSVTSIGDSAFSYCESLSCVVIGDSVTSIGDNAFYYCFRLTDVYYSGTQAQWSTISIGSSYTYLTSAKIHYNSSGRIEQPFEIIASVDAYTILVQDTNGKPISGAVVTFGSHSGTTDAEGKVTFPRLTAGQPSITVTCDGYQSYSNANMNYSKSEQGYETITLYTTDESSYKLSSAIYQNTTNGNPNGLTTDILTGTKRLSLSHPLSTGFRLDCKAVDTTNVSFYRIWQNNVLISHSTDGSFPALNIDSFAEGGNVFVRVYSADGITVDTPINLIFVDDKAQDATELSFFGDEFSFAVNDDIPFFGGSKFTFDLPNFPVEYHRSEDSIYVGFNVSLASNEKGKTFDEQWTDIKKTLTQAMTYGKLNVSNKQPIGSNLQKQLNFMMKDKNLSAKWGPVKTKLSVMGYGEGKFDENGLATIRGYICLFGSASTSVQGPTVVVWVVPVTYSVKLSADGKLAVEANYDINSRTFDADLKLDIGIGVKPFAGIGVGKAVGVGLYGNGELDMELQLVGTTISPGVNYVDLTGELGIKVYLGPLEWEKPAVHQTWHLYTRTGAVALNADSDGAPSYLAGLYDPASYTVSDLSYLEQESQWLSGGENYLMGGETEPTELTALIEGTYRNAQPVLGAAGDTPVLVYTRGNTDRGTYNAAQLVYSVYNGSTWSEPVPVDSDATADSGATLFTAPDGTLWLIYQNQSQTFPDSYELTLEDFARTSTVVAARFDAATGKFVGHTVLSTANTYASHAEIFSANGITTAVWVENTDSNYFGTNSTNAVYFAQYADGAWGISRQLVSGLNAITELTVGELNGGIAAALTIDGDNDLATPDRTVNLLTLSGQLTQLTGGTESSAIQFATLPGDITSALLWVENGTLKRYNGTETADILVNSTLSDGFIVLSDRILHRVPVEDGSVLYAQIFDGESWSEPVQITTQEGYLQSYSAAEINGSTYLAAIRTDVTITETEVEDDCDLCWAVLSDFVDLELLSVDIDQSAVQSGAEVPVTVVLKNNGSAAVDTATVQITDENGAVLASQTFADLSLAPGAETEQSITLPFGEELTLAEYTVTVTTNGDQDSENNSAAFKAGYGDLIIDAEFIRIGSSRKLMVQVTNNGVTTLGGTLNVSADGEAPKIAEISPLAPGSSSILEIPVTSSLLNGAEENILTLTVVADGEEYADYNNTTQIYATTLGTETFDVSYDANGGTGTLPAASIVVSGSAVTVASGDGLTNNDSPFSGWNTEPDGSGTPYQPGDIITVEGDITLYAQWGTQEQNGLVMDANGTWWYYIDGVLQEDFTGLVYFNETFFYVQNGMLDTSYVGLVEFMGAWYYIEGGIINFNFTGLTYWNGTFFYIQNGVLDTSYVGLVEFMGAWYYIEGGIINFGFTGLTYFNDTFFYIQNGVLDTSYVGLVEFAGAWYYIEGGIINFAFTGLTYFNGTFFYIQNGILDTSYVGLVEFAGAWYYVEGGIINFDFTGLTYWGGTFFYIQNGILDTSYVGLVEFAGAWYFVQNGMINFTYSGVAYTPDGAAYNVVNGIAQP